PITGGRRLGRLRSEETARRRGDRGARRPADLDPVHERRTERQAAGGVPEAGQHRLRADRPEHRTAGYGRIELPRHVPGGVPGGNGAGEGLLGRRALPPVASLLLAVLRGDAGPGDGRRRRRTGAPAEGWTGRGGAA